jgi:hypothetical protein
MEYILRALYLPSELTASDFKLERKTQNDGNIAKRR